MTDLSCNNIYIYIRKFHSNIHIFAKLESGKKEDSLMEDREAKSVSSSVDHKNSADSEFEIDYDAKDLNKDHFEFQSTNDKGKLESL